MKRRELVSVVAGTALAHGVVTVMGCAAETKGGAKAASPPHDHDKHDKAAADPGSPVTPELAALAKAASDCVRVAQTCLEHCLRSLATGDTMMADCARTVQQMLPVCAAMVSLAAMGSKHAAALAAVCEVVCGECAETCRPHAGHHDECGACLAACEATVAAAQKVA